MSNLFLALFVLVIAFLIHIIMWRLALPKRQTAALLGIFFGTLAAWLVASYFFAGTWFTAGTLWQAVHVTLFHAACTLAYAAAYSAIEHRSPSMALLTAVADSGAAGCTRDELLQALTDVHPVAVRLRAMEGDGMVVFRGGDYCLTRKGRAWACVFSFWQRLCSMPVGG
jgi:hypothetical protein